jgi:hypothetical protein
MACEAGRAMARVYREQLQRHVNVYSLGQLVRICGDALSSLDTHRARLGMATLLLTTLEGDSPQDGYSKLDMECQRRQGVINDLEKLIVKQDAILLNLASAWFYGQWKAETPNEAEMEKLLTEIGLWPITEDELIRRGAPRKS